MKNHEDTTVSFILETKSILLNLINITQHSINKIHVIYCSFLIELNNVEKRLIAERIYIANLKSELRQNYESLATSTPYESRASPNNDPLLHRET